MDVFCDDYQHYWETNMFFRSQELDSWAIEQENLTSAYYDSSSPDGLASSLASKNIVTERNRRKKLNDRLFALRSVVPNITKMDKASIIRDAIDHIKDLHEQQRRLKGEISELECQRLSNSCDSSAIVVDQELPVLRLTKKMRTNDHYLRDNIFEDVELKVTYVGEKTVVVSLTCRKKEGTIVKLCEKFESLKLKIITAHITAFSGRLVKTVFIQADEQEKDHLRIKIESVISSSL